MGEILQELREGVVAVGRVWLQCLAQAAFDPQRQVVPPAVGRDVVELAVVVEAHALDRGLVEGQLAGDHLVGDHRQREEVGAEAAASPMRYSGPRN